MSNVFDRKYFYNLDSKDAIHKFTSHKDCQAVISKYEKKYVILFKFSKNHRGKNKNKITREIFLIFFFPLQIKNCCAVILSFDTVRKKLTKSFLHEIFTGFKCCKNFIFCKC